MKCNIQYVGKQRNGVKKYWCTTHKSIASNNKGEELKECLCTYKELYENEICIDKENIKSIKLVYSNILNQTEGKIYIDNKEFNGVLIFNDSILHYKDLGGMLLSKLNNIKLENVKCSHCNRFHTDNGKFAYTPHKIHLCLYCGHMFRVKEPNIGNEFLTIYNDIPSIKLEGEMVSIDNICTIEYDLFNGTLLVNNNNVNRILIKGKEENICKFLNKTLENEF